MFRTTLRRMTTRALVIVLFSGLLAFAVNAVRPDGLPLVNAAEKSVVAGAENGSPISVQDAAVLLLSNRALFLDARSVGEYVAGHIKGAMSVPLDDYAVMKDQVLAAAKGKENIVTYCDGMYCPLSQELADQLRADGLTNVRVLENGWSLWTAENLPVTTGPNP